MTVFGFNDRTATLQVHKLATADDPFTIFEKISAKYDNAFILESLIGPKELAEMSVLGFDPDFTVKCDSRKFQVRDRQGHIHEEPVTDPLVQLRKLLPFIPDNRFRYIGGAVGYISYDAIRFWERIPKQKKNSAFPLFEFGLFRDGILFNHLERQAYYFCIGQSRFEALQKKISMPLVRRQPRFSHSRLTRNMRKSEFVKSVRKAQKYIYDGDIFQVVLAKRIEFRVKGELLHVYRQLREVNPSPYMYFLKTIDNCIIGSSPEMLIRITQDHVETFPIAGTRPTGENEQETALLAEQLLKDEKELAEHTMLVDLARNDIGRVCKFGSVKVKELMTIKRFSHVQHIVTHVEGKLREGLDSFDAIRAVFPAGTVTGAPKVRAMEIINELEPIARGPYAGAIGYFSFNGCSDFAITIRSLFVKKRGSAYLQSGAGIVMDSQPPMEWDETEFKANAILEALKRASD